MTKLPCAELLGNQSWASFDPAQYRNSDLQRAYMVKHQCRSNTFMFLNSMRNMKVVRGIDELSSYYLEESNRYRSNLINWRVAFELARECRLKEKGLKEQFEVLYELIGDWDTNRIPQFTDNEAKDFQMKNISRDPNRLVHLQLIAYDFLYKELHVDPDDLVMTMVPDGSRSFLMWHRTQESKKLRCTITSKMVPL